MRSSKKRKQVGRPRAPRLRPVLAARVPAEFRARIVASARAHGRNASEELMWLAEQGLNWLRDLEKAGANLNNAYAEASAVLAAAQRFASEDVKVGLEVELQRRGYTYVRGMNGGAWFDPGIDAVTWAFMNVGEESRGVLQEMLDQAAMRAVEKMKETQS